MQQAALSARDLYPSQRDRDTLTIRATLEAITRSYRGNRNTPAYQAARERMQRLWYDQGLRGLDHRPRPAQRALTFAVRRAPGDP